MKDVSEPAVIVPVIVKYAPYTTTTMTDKVDAAFRPPKNRPINLCKDKIVTLQMTNYLRIGNSAVLWPTDGGREGGREDLQLVWAQVLMFHLLFLHNMKLHNFLEQRISLSEWPQMIPEDKIW